MKQLSQYNIQVAALSETGIYDNGVKNIGAEWTLIYSGLPGTTKTRAAHGVAFCLNKTAASTWKNSGSEWEPVSERILRIRLHCTPISLTLISVYSPINPSTLAKAADADKFYSDLQNTLDRVDRNEMVMIMGDFNSRLGSAEHQTAPQCVGPFTTDVLNENGIHLLDLCLQNDLVVSNTTFAHRRIHQTTWMHQGTKTWHTLDDTLVNRKFRSSIEDVRCLRRPAGAIGTDHHLLRTKVKLHLKIRTKKTKRPPVLDKNKLYDREVLSQFQRDLSTKLQQAYDLQHDLDDKYKHFVRVMQQTAEQHLAPD
jgi:exonuclease III